MENDLNETFETLLRETEALEENLHSAYWRHHKQLTTAEFRTVSAQTDAMVRLGLLAKAYEVTREARHAVASGSRTQR